jgi:hypothetical protein
VEGEDLLLLQNGSMTDASSALPPRLAAPSPALARFGFLVARRISTERSARMQLKQGIQTIGCMLIYIALLPERLC